MPKQRTSPGDATGRKRDKLQKEHADELAKRGDEIALAYQEERKVAEEGVFDPSSGALIAEQAEDFRQRSSAGLAPGTRQVGDPGTEVDEDGILYVEGDEDGVQTNDTRILGVGMETPFPVPGGAPNDEVVRSTVDRNNRAVARNVRGFEAVEDVGFEIADEETVIIRVNTTLENVTIGVGTDYTFIEGQQYRVPKHVADHLDEKGYVWGGSYV